MMKIKQAEFLKYGIYGAATTAANLLLFIAFKESGVHYILSNSFSYFIAACLNYVLNRKYVFKNNGKSVKQTAIEFSKFIAVRLLALMADNACFYMLADLCGFPVYPVRVSLSLLSILATFVINKRFVFIKNNK